MKCQEGNRLHSGKRWDPIHRRFCTNEISSLFCTRFVETFHSLIFPLLRRSITPFGRRMWQLSQKKRKIIIKAEFSRSPQPRILFFSSVWTANLFFYADWEHNLLPIIISKIVCGHRVSA